MDARPVSWLTDRPPSGSFPNARPHSGSTGVQWMLPEASPLTVAGAARDSHPLPSTSAVLKRAKRKRTHVTRVPVGLSTGDATRVHAKRSRHLAFEGRDLVRRHEDHRAALHGGIDPAQGARPASPRRATLTVHRGEDAGDPDHRRGQDGPPALALGQLTDRPSGERRQARGGERRLRRTGGLTRSRATKERISAIVA